jgi:hypothetical protein
MLGQATASAHMSLMFDGRAQGLAAAIAQGAVDAGAEATAIICPSSPASVACAVIGCRMIVVRDDETARRMLFKLSDGIVMLPGWRKDPLARQWPTEQQKRGVFADFDGFPPDWHTEDPFADRWPVARMPNQVLSLLFGGAAPDEAGIVRTARFD